MEQRPDTLTTGTSNRLVSLDGLRGVAAVVVLLYHLSLIFPSFATLAVDRTGIPPVFSPTWWFSATPLELFFAGNPAVSVFFVLSGVVLVRSFIDSRAYDWIAYYVQRMLRLYLPGLAAIALAAMWLAIPHAPVSGQSAWMNSTPLPSYAWQYFVNASDLLFGNVDVVNSPLWTLRWELVFSLALPLFIVVAMLLRRVWWAGIVAGVVCVFIGTLCTNPSLMVLPAFLAGALIAVNLERIHALAAHPRVGSWMLPIGLVLVVISLVLASGQTIAINLGHNSITSLSLGESVQFVGAAGIVVACVVWRPAVVVLGSRFFRWLGLISFSLYLVHVPIIIATAHLVGPRHWLVIAIAGLVSVIVAVLFSRFVERPLHRLSRSAGAQASTFVTARINSR